jgi:hypothetical protein
VPGHAAVLDLVVELGERVAEPERLEQVRAHVLGERHAGHGPDDQPEHAVGEVRVLEVLRAAEHLAVEHRREQRRPVGERGGELPEVGVVPVAQRAAGVAERLAHGDAPDGGALELRHVRLEGVVEPEQPALDEPRHRDGGERLRVRRDAEEMAGAQRFAGEHVGDAPRGVEQDLAVDRHRELHARHAREAGLRGRPVREVGGVDAIGSGRHARHPNGAGIARDPGR